MTEFTALSHTVQKVRIFDECAKYNLCSIFKVHDCVYSKICKCQICHCLYKHTFKIYDSVFLRDILQLVILLSIFYSIKSHCLHKYTTELIHEWPYQYRDSLEVGRDKYMCRRLHALKSGKLYYFASMNTAGRKRLKVFIMILMILHVL